MMSNNFCQVFWNCLINFLLISLIVISTSLYTSYMIAGIAASIAVGQMIWTLPIISTVIVVLFLTLCVSVTFVVEKTKNTENKTLVSIAVIYSSWKEKYCPTVKEVE